MACDGYLDQRLHSNYAQPFFLMGVGQGFMSGVKSIKCYKELARRQWSVVSEYILLVQAAAGRTQQHDSSGEWSRGVCDCAIEICGDIATREIQW